MTYNLKFLGNFKEGIEKFETHYQDYINKLNMTSYGALYGENVQLHKMKSQRLFDYLISNKQTIEEMDKYYGFQDLPNNVIVSEAFCCAWFMVECVYPLIFTKANHTEKGEFLNQYFIMLLEIVTWLYNISDDYDKQRVANYEHNEYYYYEESLDGIRRTLAQTSTLYGSEEPISFLSVGGIGTLN